MIGILQREVRSHFDILIGLNAVKRWLQGDMTTVTEGGNPQKNFMY